MSELTECGAPPLNVLPEKSAEWLPTFVLVTVVQLNIPDPTRQLAFNVIRRSDTAVVDYTRARDELIQFLEPDSKRSITKYCRCLHSFEAAVSSTHQAYALIRQLLPKAPPMFARDDGSVLQRLDRIHNASKHADEWIAKGNRFAEDSTMSVWMTNAGLEAKGYRLSYEELAGEINDLATIILREFGPQNAVPPTDSP